MIEKVLRPWPDQSGEVDMPLYLTEANPARERTRRPPRIVISIPQEWADRSAPPPRDPVVPFGGQGPRLSPVFARMVPVGRARVAAAVYEWWSDRAKAGVVTVQRRLELERPDGDASLGWAVRGRVRRLSGRRWVPVLIELSPVRDNFTRMTMTPLVHVFVSKRYFRIGHTVLDRLTADLAATSSRPDTIRRFQ